MQWICNISIKSGKQRYLIKENAIHVQTKIKENDNKLISRLVKRKKKKNGT
jgi:hypothetical protein